MAVPLFHADVDEVAKAVRASGIPTTGDAYTIFLNAIKFARVTLIRSLGQDVISALLAAPDTDEPLTDLEVRRCTAKLIEADLVLAELLCKLPTTFLDGSADAPNWYDKESPFRLTNEDDRTDLHAKLMTRVAQMMGELSPDAEDLSMGCFRLEREQYERDDLYLLCGIKPLGL